MATNVESPGLLAEPGLPNNTATIDSVPFLISQADRTTQDLRLKFLARRLHALGEAPIYYFLRELERGADLRASLEAYAEIDPAFVKAYHGDRFMPATFLIEKGGAA